MSFTSISTRSRTSLRITLDKRYTAPQSSVFPIFRDIVSIGSQVPENEEKKRIPSPEIGDAIERLAVQRFNNFTKEVDKICTDRIC